MQLGGVVWLALLGCGHLTPLSQSSTVATVARISDRATSRDTATDRGNEAHGERLGVAADSDGDTLRAAFIHDEAANETWKQMGWYKASPTEKSLYVATHTTFILHREIFG